jgi:Histone acetyl transferase HAT1 N-terminus
MATPGFRDYHRRMQIFILLYIEAGSYIQEDDERWEFVVLYVLARCVAAVLRWTHCIQV